MLWVIKGVNLFFSQARGERILTIALITEAATVQGGEPKSQKLLIGLSQSRPLLSADGF